MAHLVYRAEKNVFCFCTLKGASTKSICTNLLCQYRGLTLLSFVCRADNQAACQSADKRMAQTAANKILQNVPYTTTRGGREEIYSSLAAN